MLHFLKRIIHNYVVDVFSESRYFRKKIKGKWYKIREVEVSGFAAPGEYWVNKKPIKPDIKILKEEDNL